MNDWLGRIWLSRFQLLLSIMKLKVVDTIFAYMLALHRLVWELASGCDGKVF